MIRKVTGFDIIDWCLHMILGENYQINPNYTINYCSITYLYGNCGIISKIHLPDDVKQNTFLYKNVDAEIGGSDNSSDRVAGVMSVGGTLRELKLNQRKLISQINITNKAGERLLEINSH